MPAVPAWIYIVGFGTICTLGQVFFKHTRYVSILQWVTLSLFAYFAAMLMVHVQWKELVRGLLWPRVSFSRESWMMIVAVLGTTISPYLFFWQASQEVEEEKEMGRGMLRQREGATKKEIITRKLDVGTGTFFSNLVMYFIILATALTLNKHGITQIETSKQAAEALLPLAGRFAYLLYAVGLIGVGFLAVPTLAGSAASAFAETCHWQQGLDRKLKRARAFYAVVILSTLVGIALDFAGVNPVKALFWTAVINGVLAPFLLVGIWLVAADAVIMKKQPSSKFSLAVVGLTTLCMFGAAIALFVF
jgi:Mn2+/Fe2+ NRAMP family transporter